MSKDLPHFKCLALANTLGKYVQAYLSAVVKLPYSTSNSRHALENSTRHFYDTKGGITTIFTKKTIRKEYVRKQGKRPSTKGNQ
jgi:hypothetical protein